MKLFRPPALPAAMAIGDPPVEVTIRQSPRAKRLTLRLAAGSGSVTLTVPRGIREAEVHAFLSDHDGWIADRLARMPPRIHPLPGTVLKVNGAALTLAQGTGRSTRLDGMTLYVPGTEDQFQRYVLAWLREQARATSVRHCDHFSGRLGMPFNRLTIRDPRTRWGSCSSEGNIMLSWRLILAPPDVLAYVAAHEIAHLKEMNHAPEFWKVVADLYPQYATQRNWLRRHGATLHRLQIKPC